AKVPEAEWSASRTVGEVQSILERHEGTAPADAASGAEASLLVRSLLEPAPARPAFREPATAPAVFGFLKAVTRACWGLDVHGLEHLPREGSFVLAGNHESYLD